MMPFGLSFTNFIYRYLPKMIPGRHITIYSSATNDRDARLLLQSIGLPFYGKVVN